MKGYHILIVEDDVMIGDLLQKILQREGYHVMWKTDGADVLSVIQKVDLVIMDVMLPGEDGYQLSAKIKKLGLRIPVIFLSARNDMDSKLQGLQIGEDYMVKPFDPRELLLRMKNMLEHHYGTFTQIKHLYIDAETKKVFIESLHDEVLFTAIERKIFFYLYENRDSTLTKEHFFEYLWQLEDRNPNIVNVHIKKIRAKINDQAGEIIENIYGEGYRLNTVVKK
ncbi:two-component system response regulator YbdJ [Bacillus inaquosorum]|uniref:Two-component system response regulator YbdJ n=1 Tax=Bacillus inaquosorum TaxID=483913 RepID=A0A9Q4HXM2_9BACI|nr:two-component system response regulator YbdJ [Bacillus inaquosorum]MCY7787546.1 two-component system response regulator YbdJ [Bacillus inaquosorum]MCY7820292.1 two-component system response regulator YbdJ [Bacillus inaquosorum]MCY7938309.1 two-component system response regulator YbdJ [Bacillus inaquosorum]MCY7941810.1 two-component system response regulator YbdJ [Bacillus inaquosorum]MCY7984022.1 two-component system response regulator YbdJ [Bacillus inaquosorum]